MTRYTIELKNQVGETIDIIEDPISVELARAFNTEGSLVVTFPYHRFDYNRFERNTRVVVWRTDQSGRTKNLGDTLWFTKRISRNVLDNTFSIGFKDAFSLLGIRIVGYTSVTPYADKTLEEFGLITYNSSLRIDNMMRAYVRENFGPLTISPITGLADSARIIDEISIEDNKSLGPYGEKQASWANIADVLRDLARMSSEKGIDLFYDLVPIENGRLEFRVWRDVRGVDRGTGSANPLEFTDSDDFLTDIEEEIDYDEMATTCYVLGEDTDASRVWVNVQNDDLVDNDPFSREEFVYNASSVSKVSVLYDIGRAAVNGMRPRRNIRARIVDNSEIVFGRDYDYGDRVTARILNTLYNCHIDAVRASWDRGQENLDIRISGSEVV